jgi:hypothetical protein
MGQLSQGRRQGFGGPLLGNCGKGMYHDPALVYGECASANTGSGSWGKMKMTDEVVYRFMEREQDWSPPQNSHLTQVLWRSTKYVGYAKATKNMRKIRFVTHKFAGIVHL